MKKKNIIKKIFVGLLLTLIVVLIAAFASIELGPRGHSLDTDVDTTESSSWMKNISDDTLVSDISIPGIHDAGANNIKLAAFSKCQDYDIATLLSFGYRYIDLRIGTASDNSLYVCHGFLKCMNGKAFLESTMGVDVILDASIAFLKEHPTETLILASKYEHGSLNDADFEKVYSDYLTTIDQNYILYTDEIPTLGEARGKIVLARRYSDALNLGKDSGLDIYWSDQGGKEVVDIPYEKASNSYVQDRYKYSVEDKWNAFTKTADKTEELLESGIVLNFLSTNGTPKFGLPYLYAQKLNKNFKEKYKDTKIKGWIIVDFGDIEMSKIIYQSNFK